MPNDVAFYIPPLVEAGKVIVPGAQVGIVEYRTRKLWKFDRPLRIMEYQELNPPTLAQLRHAYFDKDSSGKWVCPEYRDIVRGDKNNDLTSTFLLDGNRCVEHPTNLHKEKTFYQGRERKVWIVQGNVKNIELPPEGWILEFDKPTGLPSRTSNQYEDAEKIFGSDASAFRYSRRGLRAVSRRNLGFAGTFVIDATRNPLAPEFLGARPCKESK
ncbi:MAG: hypothetical protein V1731_02765 [Candidatus Aenigmatarchaeota archaeon]